MTQSGYTGISYPFRINNRGGSSVSTTGFDDPSHIVESITQIFGTNPLERPMNPNVYNTLTPLLFEPRNEALQQVMKFRMVEDLTRLEDRIECSEQGISFVIETDEEKGVEIVYALISFLIIKYNTSYTSKIKVGEINNE